MSGNELEHVFDEKDLGVTIDGELTFEEHIARKIRIANGIVGQIRRSFSYLDCETFRRIYCAFVQPHLEYGQAAWAPHRVKEINALENVQIRATKLVDGLAKLDYAERLKRLNLPTLAFRRQRGDMIETYKHFHTYDKSTLSPTFMPRNRPSRKHNFQLLSRKACNITPSTTDVKEPGTTCRATWLMRKTAIHSKTLWTATGRGTR